jgi:hypothetical protein
MDVRSPVVWIGTSGMIRSLLNYQLISAPTRETPTPFTRPLSVVTCAKSGYPSWVKAIRAERSVGKERKLKFPRSSSQRHVFRIYSEEESASGGELRYLREVRRLGGEKS